MGTVICPKSPGKSAAEGSLAQGGSSSFLLRGFLLHELSRSSEPVILFWAGSPGACGPIHSLCITAPVSFQAVDALRAGAKGLFCRSARDPGSEYVTGTAAGAFVIINLGSVTLGWWAVTLGPSRRDCSAGLDSGLGSLGVGVGGQLG